MSHSAPPQPHLISFTPYQKRVLAMLAFLQFTIVLDFMVLSPLGAMLIPSLHITTKEFGWVVSMYAFAAGASGILSSGFADRFDRKKILMFFYSGFLLATLVCGLANDYTVLMVGRTLAGLFGGVIGSIVMAITTDLFPLAMRGRVMGVVQTAFGASQILGIPIALKLSTMFDWHAPFFLIVGVGAVAFVFIALGLHPINEHLKNPRHESAFAHLARTLKNKRYLQGFTTTALMATGGFMLMPFGSQFSVRNIGIGLDDLPKLYMVSGLCALVTGPLIGRISDAIGKYRTFVVGSTIFMIFVTYYTHMGPSSLVALTAVNCIMFMGVQSRMISAGALMSAVPAPGDRGAYMSVQSSIQQVSGGLAAALAGQIVVQPETGPLLHFDWVGYVILATTVFTIAMMGTIDRMVRRDAPGATLAPPIESH